MCNKKIHMVSFFSHNRKGGVFHVLTERLQPWAGGSCRMSIIARPGASPLSMWIPA